MTTNIRLNKDSLIPLTLFPLVPFISILLFTIIFSFKKRINKSTFYIFFFLLALFLAFINATKFPAGDLILYYEHFKASDSFSFFDYLLRWGKEPFFYALTYFLYHLTQGSTNLYIIFITSISYFIYFTSVYRYFKRLNTSNSLIIFAILLAAFLPQLFSLSAHILRQFLGASILFYAMVEKLCYGKKVWPYLLIAFFTHSTTLLFIPLLFIKPLNNKINLKSFSFIALIAIVIGFFLNPIVEFVIKNIGLGHNMITYVLFRVAQERFFQIEPLNTFAIILLMLLMLTTLIALSERVKKISTNTKGQVHIFNIFLIFTIFILANIQQPEISVRFFFYCYFFFPFIFPLLLKFRKKKFNIIRLAISLLVILGFVFNLKYSIWKYGPLEMLLINPILPLIF